MDVHEAAPEDPRLNALALILQELLEMMEHAPGSPAPRLPAPGESEGSATGPEPAA